MKLTVISALVGATAGLRVGIAPTAHPSRVVTPSCSIAVFGASGATGSEAVLQALERGEDVTCLVRDSTKLKAPRTAAGFTEGAPFGSDKLTVATGSVTNKADVEKVFEGKDVTGVVVALGGKTKDVGATMLQDGTANIIAVMKANGVKKISVVTTSTCTYIIWRLCSAWRVCKHMCTSWRMCPHRTTDL